MEEPQSNKETPDPKIEWLKNKLRKALTLSKFCGLCLDSDKTLVPVDIDMVLGNQPFSKNLQDLLNYVFNDDIGNFMSSPMLCDECVKKVIQSYLFIHNTKQMSRLMNDCVYDLQSKVIGLDDQVCANVMIILDHNKELCESIIDTPNPKEKAPTEIPKLNYINIEISPEIEDYASPTSIENIKEKLMSNKELNITPVKRGSQFRKPQNQIKKNQKPVQSNTVKSNKDKHTLDSLKPNSGNFQCNMCLKVCDVEEEKDHKCKFGCPECPPFMSCIHTRFLISYRDQVLSGAKKFKCADCDHVTSRKVRLIGHANREHLENYPFTCAECGQGFFNKDKLKRHLMNGHKQPPTSPLTDLRRSRAGRKECQICDKTFKKRGYFESHMNRFHFKIKPYVCNICNKSFCGPPGLKLHEATHTREKTCYCHVCHKKFANRVCLKIHLRIHTGETPYQCDECGLKFKSLAAMKIHTMKKHLNKTISCPLCSNKYYVIGDMRHHFRQVHWKDKTRPFDPALVPGLSEVYYHLFEDRRLAIL